MNIVRRFLRRAYDVRRFFHIVGFVPYILITKLVRLPFNWLEKLETHLIILCDFIRTMAVELLRFSYACYTNVYERQKIETENLYDVRTNTVRAS